MCLQVERLAAGLSHSADVLVAKLNTAAPASTSSREAGRGVGVQAAQTAGDFMSGVCMRSATPGPVSTPGAWAPHSRSLTERESRWASVGNAALCCAGVMEVRQLPTVLLYPEGAPGLMRYTQPCE